MSGFGAPRTWRLAILPCVFLASAVVPRALAAQDSPQPLLTPDAAASDARWEDYGWPASGGLFAVPPSGFWGADHAPRHPQFHWLRQVFRHHDPDDPGRQVGWGQPLVGTSWRNRPFHAGWLYGGLYGDELIRGRVDQDEDMLGGYRLGWDFDHYWGSEFRFAFANVELSDARGRTSRDLFWDWQLAYYPWGDARWRPFFSIGAGVASFRFRDDLGRGFDETLFTVPVGAGVKYYCDRWLALRMSVMDHWSIGAGSLHTMHNFSVTAGVEVRFGGPRTSYFPFHPGLHLW